MLIFHCEFSLMPNFYLFFGGRGYINILNIDLSTRMSICAFSSALLYVIAWHTDRPCFVLLMKQKQCQCG